MMEIKVLGTGCARCTSLEKATREAVNELGIEATVTKVEDIIKIITYGIMHTPGLVINEKVIISKRVPTVSDLKNLIL